MQADATPAESTFREIPLSTLALAPENVRKTPADSLAHDQLKASIAAHGLLENLVVRPVESDGGAGDRFAVVAGGRRLSALNDLAEDGLIATGHPVPCLVVSSHDGSEVSLAENTVRIAMHPADQVTAFAALADAGLPVSAIAMRFGVSERTVEQRLRLGNAAPKLLAAFRAGEIGLEALMAFAVTTDHERQLAVWEQLSQQPYGPSAWQVKRLLTEERVAAASKLARYVGVEAYEAAGGAVLRDLFADEDENGVWLEDAALLEALAQRKLQAIADELSTRWKWAEAWLEVEWGDTARFGRVRPTPGQPTDGETAERERLLARHDELVNLDEEEWTEALEFEAEAIEPRLTEINETIAARATYAREDFSVAGCIATVGGDGKLELIQGLVRPEDMPKPDAAKGGAGQSANGSGAPVQGSNSASDADPGTGSSAGAEDASGPDRIEAPMVSPPQATPADPAAKAREEAGVGLGLADDLRAIRTALVKTQLAGDFDAAFDLAVFQFAQSVFGEYGAGSDDAFDIACRETPDRPRLRTKDDTFAQWSPGEAVLADWSDLPLAWMDEKDSLARFDALKNLPRADKEKLFAAAVARTLKGQLAFEHGARPEFEATVARLGIDFAQQVRPGADVYWSRLRKDRMLAVAREVFGPAWAQARAKYNKPDLAAAMEEGFAAGPRPVGVDAKTHAAALVWALPGFRPFDGVDGEVGESDGTPIDESESGSEGTPMASDPAEPDGTPMPEPDVAPIAGNLAVGDNTDAAFRGEAGEDAGSVNGSGESEAQSGAQPNHDAQSKGSGSASANGEVSSSNGSRVGRETDAETGSSPTNGNGVEPGAPAGANGGPPASAGVAIAESAEIPAFLQDLS